MRAALLLSGLLLTGALAIPVSGFAQSPCAVAARVDHGWSAYRSGALADARAAFASVRAACPDHTGALVGLAYVDLRQDRRAEARHALEQVLRVQPDHADARKALARLEAREGRLETADREWQRVLELHPSDVEALVGRAQTLRWLGDARAARPLLERAADVAPHDAALADERAWNRADAGLGVQTRLTHERDTDDNRITTLSLGGAYTVTQGVRLAWDTYLRSTGFGTERDRKAAAYHLTTTVTLPSGWRVSGGVGASETSVLGQDVTADLDVALRSPVGHAVQGGLRVSRSARNFTSTLIERGVRADELGVDGGWASGPWAVQAATAVARYRGTESNRYWSAGGRADRTLGAHLQLGVVARGFGFTHDVRDGYFDPGHFALVELPVRAQGERGAWSGFVEVAGGLQTSALQDGTSFAPRTAAEARYRLAPGREVALTGSWTRSDALRLSGGSGAYRYTSIGLAGAWVF